MTNALSIRGLEVRVGKQPILGPIELEIPAGQHVLLVGPSGCGKTTLLRAIAGLAAPHAGTITIDGKLADEGGTRVLKPAERGVGMLFQNGALWPHMRAAKQLRFVLRSRGVGFRARRRRAKELLNLVELSGYGRRTPGTLSGGEAQRLALARALASDPRVLLLDEPLGPLDAELRASLLASLVKLRDELGLTIVHVTHDPAGSADVAHRVLRMEDGRIVGDVSAGRFGADDDAEGEEPKLGFDAEEQPA
ncbi:MAG: ATP-binding cassette domain-containing protein [Planctomycetes bacterium]|nr:ATP-binding cassette domain-containing protein [Planctomycetota bacterium]MCB9904274.1 ATP-binding cassette domain-containing protein [Planctomycetota bacterium]